MGRSAAIMMICALTGCGQRDNDPGPGGVTVGEARALNEAAEMLEQRRVPAELIEPRAPASSEGADRAPQK